MRSEWTQLSSALIALAALTSASNPAAAQTTVWTPATTDFNLASNWSNGIPIMGFQAQFDNLPIPALRSLTFNSSITLSSMLFTGGGYTFEGGDNPIIFNNGGEGASIEVESTATGNIVFSSPVQFTDPDGAFIRHNGSGVLMFWGSGSNSAIHVGTTGVRFSGTGNITVQGTRFGGSGDVTMNGTGKLSLPGNLSSSWAGRFILNSGTLEVATAAAFGVMPSAPIPDALTFNGGTLATTSTTFLGVNRGITVNSGGMTVAGVGTLNVAGAVTGAGSLTKTGSGTLNLSGLNTYSGGTQIGSGWVVLNSQSAASTGAISITPSAAVTVNSAYRGSIPNNWIINPGVGEIEFMHLPSDDGAPAAERISILSGNFSGTGSASFGKASTIRSLLAVVGDNSAWGGNLKIAGSGGFSDELMSVFVAPQSFPSGNTSLGASGRISSLLSSGTMAKELGSGPGQFQWTSGTTGRASIGARGAPLQLTFNNGNTLTWGEGGFVNAGQALGFGDDTFGEHSTTLTNSILLTTTSPATRVVQAFGQRGVLSGNLLESPGVPGTLDIRSGVIELAGTGSTLTGGILVSGGRLAFLQDSNLGPAATPITITSGGIRYDGAGLTLNRTINFQSQSSAVVEVTGPGATLTISGNGTPTTRTFYKLGPGELDMQRPYDTGTLTTIIDNGTLTLSGPNGSSRGSGTIGFNFYGKQLRLDNALANNNDRVAGGINIAGHEVVLVGNPVVPTSETVSQLSFQIGGYLTLDNNSGPGVAITETQAFVAPGSTPLGIVRGPGLGTAQARLFLNTPAIAVLPGMLGDHSLSGAGSFLVGYNTTDGVVPTAFVTNGPIQSGPAPVYPLAHHNNGNDGPSFTTGAANVIAGLKLSGSSPSVEASSGSLEIVSGMIMVEPGTTNARLSGNTITSPSPFRFLANSDLTLDAALRGPTAAVIKYGPDTLHLDRSDALNPSGFLYLMEGKIDAHGFDQTTGTVVGRGALDLGAADLTITGTVNPFGQVSGTLVGKMSGTGSLTIQTAEQGMSGDMSGFSGRVAVQGGTLYLSSQAALMTSQPVAVTFAIGSEGSLEIGENIYNGALLDRMPNRPTMDLASSTLRLHNTTAASTVTQELGRLTGTGTSRVMPVGRTIIATFAGLDVTPDVGWIFQEVVARNSNLSTHTVKFITPPTLSTTGGGAAGTDTVSVAPGVIMGPIGSSAVYRLATYSPTDGLRPLMDNESRSTIGSSINQNLRLSFLAPLPQGLSSINSLTLDSGGNFGTVSPPGQATLRIGSGQVLINHASAVAFPAGMGMDMNGQTGRIFATGNANSMLVFDVPVANTGDGGLVFHNFGQLTEVQLRSTDAARNTFSGLTINGREVLNSSSQASTGQFINASFVQDVNLGAPDGRITLNTARLTYAGTTPLTMNRALRIGAGGAEVATTQALTFSGPSAALSGWGTLTKVGTGALALAPRELAPGNYDGTPATLILNVPALAGSMSLAMNAGSNFTWDLRGVPGSYLSDLLVLAGAVGPSISIDPLATLTVDLSGIDRAALIADLGGIGASRDFTVIDAALNNTQNFAAGQVLLTNASGFAPGEFSTLLVNGDVVLRFLPVPAPASVGILAVVGIAAARRRR